MSKKFYASIAVVLMALMLASIATVPAGFAVQRIGIPRFDEIQAIVEEDPDTAWIRFQAGEFDFLPDIIRYTIIESAQNESHQTFSMPGFHVCYSGINTRDYVPADGGAPDAGRPLAPLNWTEFRQALAWSGLSLEEKEAAITEIYGEGVVVPSYTIIPEALGVWHNPNVTSPGGNFTKAWEILEDAGFYIDGGILYQPNGVAVRDEIAVLSPVEAPTSVEFCKRFVLQWNNFTQVFLGVTNCVFIHSPIPFIQEIYAAFLYRNFDIYWLCWGLSRFPDFIYDFFHSSQDFPWGYNSPGIADPTLDALLEEVKWGLVYEEKLEACWEAQRLLVEVLVPYIYFYHRIYWCIARAHTPDAVVNVINMKGVGADNGWTWNLAHWNTSQTGGIVKYNLGTVIDTLHPGWASSAYEAWILDRVLDGLTAVNPDLEDMPWIAVDWEMAPFTWTPLNIYNGTKVTFRIRDDAMWHDGWPVTVEDIRFSWEFMKNFPRFFSTYQYLMWIEVHDPNTISAYLNITSQYIVYDFAGLALLFPKHIYNPDWHPTRDTINDEVWTISWQDWMADYTGPVPSEVAGWSPGDPSPTGIPPTALVGCGPYYFVSWDEGAETAIVRKNPGYWVKSPIVTGIDAAGRIDPETDTPFEVLIENVGAKDDTGLTLVPVSIDFFEVIIDGSVATTVIVGAFIDPFDYTYYSVPGSVLNLPCGVYNVTIAVYETGDPVNPIAVTTKFIIVTAREDLNYDIYVGIDDIVRAAEAFGSQPPPFPGHERWDERADLNDDNYVGIDDIVNIAEDFGAC